MYDTIAKEYAEKFYGEHEKKPQDREMLYKFSQEVAGKKPIWDFGCGPGQTAKYLKDLGIEISGLDLSEKLIEQANILYPGIPFQKGNLLDLEFEDQSIGGGVAFYAIVHFSEEQAEKAFREVFRVLQPGGVFLLTYHIGEGAIHLDEFLGKRIDMDFVLFKTDFISRSLTNVGFERIEVIERDPYPDVEYPSRRAYVFAKKPAGQEQPESGSRGSLAPSPQVSRPADPPRQPLAEPDVNLSVHPAPIIQPLTRAQAANVQTNSAFVFGPAPESVAHCPDGF